MLFCRPIEPRIVGGIGSRQTLVSTLHKCGRLAAAGGPFPDTSTLSCGQKDADFTCPPLLFVFKNNEASGVSASTRQLYSIIHSFCSLYNKSNFLSHCQCIALCYNKGALILESNLALVLAFSRHQPSPSPFHHALSSFLNEIVQNSI